MGDILSHSESAYVTRAVCGNGTIDVAGEIELGILAKRAGEKELVSYERLIPFRTEIACDEAESHDGCDASLCAVSYTHLDVYKRQTCTCASRWARI